MDPKQITSLAKLLKDNGDKVLNAEYQLALSGPLLRALNDSFSLIVDQNEVVPSKTFQVTKNYNAKSDVFRELQFIYDFVQKTIFLSLNLYANDEPCEHIDISKFRSLRKIEVNHIPIEKVYGLQQLRPQMYELHCIRSLKNVEDVILLCGGDKSNGHLWSELKVADFSYNMLTKIDNAFEFAPMLQNLNLSNNKLVSVQAVKWLPNLKVLNLSFNRLTEIPLFHADTTKRLQVLLITNNFVEDLAGLACLDGLCELDLSRNCLLDHSTLLPVSTLAALQYLNLKGNPISSHPRHRQTTASYLHRNTSTGVLMLDGAALSKTEKTLTGKYVSQRPKVLAHIVNRSSMTSMSSRISSDTTPRSSVDSQNSLVNQYMQGKNTDEQRITPVMQRRPQHRHIPLEDDTPVIKKTLTRDPSTDHLITKKMIEEQAEKHGANWLDSKNKLGTALGFKELSPPIQNMLSPLTPTTPRTPDKSDASSVITSTPKEKSGSSQFFSDFGSPIDTTTSTGAFKSVMGTTTNETSGDVPAVRPKCDRKISLFATIEKIQNSKKQEAESDPEENEKEYVVTEIDSVGKDLNDFILVISDQSMKEKSTDTGRTQNRWGLETLESCESKRSDTITLRFDTVKRDRQSRTYRISSEQEAKQLLNFLRNILSQRDLCDMKVYSCAKCLTQFSCEVKPNMMFSCPNCKSPFVIELRTSVMPSMPELPEPGPSTLKEPERRESPKRGIQNMWKSASRASIESTGSLHDSQSSCSKISQSESSFDSNQSVAGSSDNSDRDKDIDLLGRGDGAESDDIEILSNPSQSSIEVLDTYYSNRKISSEERHIAHRPSLETIDDESQQVGNLSANTLTNQETSTSDLDVSALKKEIAELAEGKTNNKSEDVPTTVVSVMPAPIEEEKKEKLANQKKSAIVGGVLLTESSSSGSVTDSICTAYEQNQMVKSSDSETGTFPKRDVTEDSKAASKNEVSVITSMLGGLFQSTNLLMSKTPKVAKVDMLASQEPYRYSYQDFTNVDHRLKLFFFQTVFEDAGELMNWLVKGRFVDETQAIANNTGFDGFLLVSTTKFYVFQMVDKESDDPSQWLKKHLSGTIDRLCAAKVLPWKMGLTFTVKSYGTFHLLLHDIYRTDSLLLFLADNPLPPTFRLDYQTSEIGNQKLHILTSQKQVKTLAIFNECRVTVDDQHQINDIGALCVTDADLFLLQIDTNWLNDGIGAAITVSNQQEMANLIEVDIVDATTFKLNFMNETEDKFEMWKIMFETTETAETTIRTISNWWEKIFGVPLISCSNNVMEVSINPNAAEAIS